MNHWFPLPLLWAKGTTLPLEVVDGYGGALVELGVELEAPITLAMVEGSGAEVEANMSCFLLVPVVCLCEGGGIGCIGICNVPLVINR